MDILITYGIESSAGEAKNSAVKDAMKAERYFDQFTTTDSATQLNITHYLPNTSLWKQEITAEVAKADLLRIAKVHGAVVERLLVTEFVNWASITGKKYEKNR